MDKKPITIRDVLLTDVEKFKKLQVNLNIKPNEVFTLLIKNTEKNGKHEINAVNVESLQKENQTFTEVNQILQAENLELQSKYNSLRDSKPNEIEVPIKLKGTQFIFEPTETMAKNMQRVIAYLKREGKLNEIERKNYLQEFIIKAVNYIINNEYKHLLK